jgi:hypothetical protein
MGSHLSSSGICSILIWRFEIADQRMVAGKDQGAETKGIKGSESLSGSRHAQNRPGTSQSDL